MGKDTQLDAVDESTDSEKTENGHRLRRDRDRR